MPAPSAIDEVLTAIPLPFCTIDGARTAGCGQSLVPRPTIAKDRLTLGMVAGHLPLITVRCPPDLAPNILP
jgi:hypothetical protein